MAKKRSEKRHMQEMIELGKVNAELIPDIQGWCQNLRIRQESAGLLAQFAQLPIGFLSIECDHAGRGGMQAMQLAEVATSFILRNCVECKHRKTILVRNFGARLLEEREKREEETKEKVPERAALERVKLQVADDLPSVIDTKPTTERSILQHIVLLGDEQRGAEAAAILPEAAKIAPELFSDLAVLALCDYFDDWERGKAAIATVTILLQLRGEMPDRVFEAAARTLESRQNVANVSELIASFAERGKFEACLPLIPFLAASLYAPIPQLRSSATQESKVIDALRRLAALSPEAVADSLNTRLEINNKSKRIGTSRAICRILPSVPRIGSLVAPALLKSLELDDDQYDESADSAACLALAEILVIDPDCTEVLIDRSYAQGNEEIKEIIVGIYDAVIRRIAWPESQHSERNELSEKIASVTKRVVRKLMGLVGISTTPVGIRMRACETIELVAKYLPEIAVEFLDSLLGAMAITCYESIAEADEESSAITPSGANEVLHSLERSSHSIQRRGLASRLSNAICELSESFPSEVHSRIDSIIPNLNSKTDSTYKAALIRVYGKLGQRYELLPLIIPALFKHLMNFDSTEVRGAAVSSISDLLQRNIRLPSNLLDALSILLIDTYVYVHKQAVRAVRFFTPSNHRQAVDLLGKLVSLMGYYEKRDPDFIREIIEAMFNIADPFVDLTRWVIHNAAIPFIASAPGNIADDILESWGARLNDAPESKSLFIQSVIQFMTRVPRDPYLDNEHSPRERAYRKLFTLPKPEIICAADQIDAATTELLLRDQWEAFKLMELLSFVEEHERVANIALQMMKRLPQTEKYNWAITHCAVLAAAEMAENLIYVGESAKALELLEEALTNCEKEKEPSDEIGNFAEIFDLARRVAKGSR